MLCAGAEYTLMSIIIKVLDDLDVDHHHYWHWRIQRWRHRHQNLPSGPAPNPL